MKKTTIIAAILGVLMVLGGGGAAIAFAASSVLGALPGAAHWAQGIPGFGMGRGRGVSGTVASVTSTGFTVTVPGKTGTAAKTVTVAVTSQTKVTLMPAMTAGSQSDIVVGAKVRVTGQANSSGVIQAQSVVIEPAGDMAGGRVTAVNGTTITVSMGWQRPGQGSTANTKTTNIATDANTKFYQPGGKAAMLADVKVGGFVQAWGQKQADGSLLATEVVVGPAGQMASLPRGAAWALRRLTGRLCPRSWAAALPARWLQ